VDLGCSNLQLSRYYNSKTWWLRKIPEDLKLQNIAVITRNVASKYYCLLQVLVTALLLVSCAAIVKRYPDPLNCHKYYLRIDNSFYHLTCPNLLVFDQYKEKFTLKNCKLPDIMWLNDTDCNQNKEGYYCNSISTFTYCTHDGFKIVENANCPVHLSCIGQKSNYLCKHY
jgi:hypothetical protein